MATYSVGVQNSFDVLGEEDGKPQKKKVEKKEVKAPTKKPIPSTAITAAVSAELPSEKPFAGRGPLQDSRGGRGGRGRGRGRGGRPPKRDSDRVSGTGRGREVRKGGAGGYAAEGTMNDDLAAQSTPAIDPVPEVEEVVVPELTEEQKEAALKKQQEEEEEAKKITLDQFYAKEKEKTVKDDQNRVLREVKIDEKKFKTGTVIAKGKKDIGTTLYENEDPFANKDKENKEKKKSDEKSNKKQKLNLFEFKEKTAPAAAAAAPASETSVEPQQPFIQAGSRTSRGGRGAGRGTRGGRGAGRGGAVRNPRVKIEDMDSFPKLGLAK